MPRIRRWHPVSHDFVRDREVQELRRRFGDWTALAWLEMLAEADKNEGRIKGDRASVAKGLTWVSLSNRPSYSLLPMLNAIGYMIDKAWIEEHTWHLFVRNYPEYHKTREKKESRAGTKEVPSFLPSLPILPTKVPRQEQIHIGGGPADAPPPAIWPEGLKDVERSLESLNVGNGMRDPGYWTAIDAWVESTGLKIYYLDELKAYLAHQIAAAPRRKHRNQRQGFRNWLAKKVYWEENRAQREAVKAAR